MKIANNSPKGKWVHVKINGFSYKKWVAGYDSIKLGEVTSKTQLNLNSHEDAMIKAAKKGTEIDPASRTKELFYYSVAATTGVSGTTSLSGGSVMIQDGKKATFSVYPQANCYLSAYTINGVSQTKVTPSATTTYSTFAIVQDSAIRVAFAAFGS